VNVQLPIASSNQITFLNHLIQTLQRYFTQVVSKDEETPRIILRSSNGTLYQVNVSNNGRLYTSPVDQPGSPVILGTLFSARMTSGFAIPATAGAPTYQPPADNVGGYFSQSTGRFSPPTGIYRFTAQVGTTVTANNTELYVAIWKNGSEVARGASSASQSGIIISSAVSGHLQLTAGDYVEARIWSDHTGQTIDPLLSAFGGNGEITQ